MKRHRARKQVVQRDPANETGQDPRSKEVLEEFARWVERDLPLIFHMRPTLKGQLRVNFADDGRRRKLEALLDELRICGVDQAPRDDVTGSLTRLSIATKLTRRLRTVAQFKEEEAYEEGVVPRASADDPAAQILFDDDPVKRQALIETIVGANAVYREGTLRGDGGRRGVLLALELARQILSRLPDTGVPISMLCEVLLVNQEILAGVHEGRVRGHPMLRPSTPKGAEEPRRGRKAGQRRSARQQEFEVRCIFAVRALVQSREIDQAKAIKQVYQVAKVAADALDLFPGRGSGLGGRPFTATTIRNWCAAFDRDLRKGVDSWCRFGFSLAYLGSAADLWLDTLKPEHIDLPLSAWNEPHPRAQRYSGLKVRVHYR